MAFLFIAFGVVALGAAVAMATRRTMLHAAWFLILTGLGVAGLLFLLETPVLAAIHLLACGCGAIALARKGAAPARQATQPDEPAVRPRWWAAALAAAALGGPLGWAAFRYEPFAGAGASAAPLSLADLVLLATTTAVLLAVAVAGAVMIARKR